MPDENKSTPRQNYSVLSQGLRSMANGLTFGGADYLAGAATTVAGNVRANIENIGKELKKTKKPHKVKATLSL